MGPLFKAQMTHVNNVTVGMETLSVDHKHVYQPTAAIQCREVVARNVLTVCTNNKNTEMVLFSQTLQKSAMNVHVMMVTLTVEGKSVHLYSVIAQSLMDVVQLVETVTITTSSTLMVKSSMTRQIPA